MIAVTYSQYPNIIFISLMRSNSDNNIRYNYMIELQHMILNFYSKAILKNAAKIL